MKKILFFVSFAMLVLCLPIIAFSQIGTPRYSWDESFHYHTFSRDSCSSTDSNLVQYTPAHNEYYRGFYVIGNGSAGTPTYRLCTLGSETTSLDSTVATIRGVSGVWISQRSYPKTTLVAGTVYRIQFIEDATKRAMLNQVIVLITSDR